MSVTLAALSEAVGGLPGPRSEAWKYTSLRALSARNFATSVEYIAVDPAALAAIPAPRIVFVNGRYNNDQSQLRGLTAGISVLPLSLVLADDDDDCATQVLDRRYDGADEAFVRLNASLAKDGAWVRIDADVQVAMPLHLVFVGAPTDADLAIHSRHLIELRENSALTVVEHHLAIGSHRNLTNHLVHVHLKPGSRLVHARVQDDDAGATQIARTDAVLASDAEYRRIDLELGAGLSRHELNVSLQGEQARVIAGGALLAAGRQHVDTRLGIEHVARDASCDLRWRGLANGRGRVAFHGGITIRAGADGSDAMLSSKNLLLSDSAEIDTQPVLEIHADEVKAAHGATVGRLNDTALFYLRTRGIPEDQARAMLTLAFCKEILSILPDPALIESLSAILEARLSQPELAP